MAACFRTYVCGIFFALLDLLHGVSVLAFYSYQQWEHTHCTYTHRVPECEYFLYRSNHSLRTKIGIAEGIACVLISMSLFFCYHKEKTFAVWSWLTKPLVCMVMNLYFVITWLVQRGRYYHSYETEDQEWQERVFIIFNGVTAGLHFIMAFIFCCTSAGFIYNVRRNRRHQSAYSLNTETKV